MLPPRGAGGVTRTHPTKPQTHRQQGILGRGGFRQGLTATCKVGNTLRVLDAQTPLWGRLSRGAGGCCLSSLRSLASAQGQRSINPSRAMAELTPSQNFWPKTFPVAQAFQVPPFGPQPLHSASADSALTLAAEMRQRVSADGEILGV